MKCGQREARRERPEIGWRPSYEVQENNAGFGHWIAATEAVMVGGSIFGNQVKKAIQFVLML